MGCASFKKAKMLMLEGKKICRPSWKKNSYWSLGSAGIILYSDGTPAEIHINQTEAYDWEVWKENKTLSDYDVMMNDRRGLFYPEDKVKKAIKDLREGLLINGAYHREIDNKIIEIFGSKLTEEQ